jgi:hypothetical protein
VSGHRERLAKPGRSTSVILSPMPARKITCGECGASEAFPDGDWNEVQRLEIAAWAEAHKLSPSGAGGSVGTVPRATADRRTRRGCRRSVLVPEHQEFGIFRHLAPCQHHLTAEQAAREHVTDRADHPAMISARGTGQARRDQVIEPYKIRSRPGGYSRPMDSMHTVIASMSASSCSGAISTP